MKRYQVVNRDKFRENGPQRWRTNRPRSTTPGRTARCHLPGTAAHPHHRRLHADAGPGFRLAAHGEPHAPAALARLAGELLRRESRLRRRLHRSGAGVGRGGAVPPYLADPVRFFRERGAEFDAIVLSRHYIAIHYLGLARLYAPQARGVRHRGPALSARAARRARRRRGAASPGGADARAGTQADARVRCHPGGESGGAECWHGSCRRCAWRSCPTCTRCTVAGAPSPRVPTWSSSAASSIPQRRRGAVVCARRAAGRAGAAARSAAARDRPACAGGDRRAGRRGPGGARLRRRSRNRSWTAAAFRSPRCATARA